MHPTCHDLHTVVHGLASAGGDERGQVGPTVAHQALSDLEVTGPGFLAAPVAEGLHAGDEYGGGFLFGERARTAPAHRRILNGLVAEFGAWLKQVNLSHTRNDDFAVGAIEPQLLDRLSQRGIEPETAAILAHDVEAAHALREIKAFRTTADGLPKAVTIDELSELPRLLVDRRAVLLDPFTGSLLYVFDPPERSAGKVVVYINFRSKLASVGKQTYNAVQTVSLTETQNLVDSIDAGELELMEGKL